MHWAGWLVLGAMLLGCRPPRVDPGDPDRIGLEPGDSGEGYRVWACTSPGWEIETEGAAPVELDELEVMLGAIAEAGGVPWGPSNQIGPTPSCTGANEDAYGLSLGHWDDVGFMLPALGRTLARFDRTARVHAHVLVLRGAAAEER